MSILSLLFRGVIIAAVVILGVQVLGTHFCVPPHPTIQHNEEPQKLPSTWYA